MRLVVIESPYAGDVAKNLRYLRAAMADCLARGEAPYASHGLYTQPGVLDDRIPDERAKGMRAGFAWGAQADARVVYEDLGVTPGMLAGIERAEKMGQPVERRRIPDWDAGSGFFGNIVDGEAIVPGATVELVAKEKPRYATMLMVTPQVGDRGRVVRLVHHRIEGEPLEEETDPVLAHVLLEGQNHVIGFPRAVLRRLPAREFDNLYNAPIPELRAKLDVKEPPADMPVPTGPSTITFDDDSNPDLDTDPDDGGD